MSEPGVSSEIFRFLEARLSSPCSSPVQHEAVHTPDEFVSVAMDTGCCATARTSTTSCCIATGASTTLCNLVNELRSRDLDGLLNRQDGRAHGVATQLAHPPS